MLWIASFICFFIAGGRLHSQSLDRYEQHLKETWGITPSWERTDV